MALITSPVPNLVGGVSQQPEALRFPGQAEIQVNAMATAVEGLYKRPPTENVARLLIGDAGSVVSHLVNRDVGERYVVAAGDQSVLGDNALRVYDLDGNAKTIRDSGGSPADSADFAYLDCTDPKSDLRFLTVNDYTFVLNRTKTVQLAADLSTDPGNQALIVVKQGNYGTEYTVRVEYGSDWIQVTKETEDGGTSSHVDDIKTTSIALHIVEALTTGSTTDGQTVTTSGGPYLLTAGNGWNVVREGSIILIERTDTSEDFDITVEDSVSNTVLGKVKDTVDSFVDLPTVAPNGFVTKVVGDPETAADDYYVKFITDNGNDFESGYWQETVAPGIQYKLDSSTMPHLLIRQADGDFRFTPADGHSYTIGSTTYTVPVWGEREAGDGDSNPDPSFVGSQINDVFFFKNRLGLLSKENVVLSEAAAFFNFFRLTVNQLLDSAVIDVTAAHTKVAVLNHAVPFVEVLVLFSDQTQFVLRSEGLLSPRTVSITPTSEYENSPNVTPVATGDAVFFPTTRGSYSSIREYRDVSSQRLTFEALDITATVPKYIEGVVTGIASSDKEDMLVVQADGDTSKLWVYKYFVNGGQRVQSSWFQFSFGSDADIKSCDFIESDLYILVQRGEGLFLEKLTVEPGQTDSGSDFLIHLDRKISEADCTFSYDSGSNQTTITLPYDIALLENLIVNPSDFTGSAWSLSGNCTVTGNTYTGPDGTLTADTIFSDGGDPLSDNIYQDVSVEPNSDVEYRYSVYLRKDDTYAIRSQHIIFLIDNADGLVDERINFSINLDTGAVEVTSYYSQGSSAYTEDNIKVTSVGSYWFVEVLGFKDYGGKCETFRIRHYPGEASGVNQDLTLWGSTLNLITETADLNPMAVVKDDGVAFKILSAVSNKIVVSGDASSSALYVGQQYTMRYVFSKPYLQTSSQRGGSAAMISGRYQIRYGAVLYEDTGYFKVLVTPAHQGAYQYTFTGSKLGQGVPVIGKPSIESGSISFPVMGRHNEVSVEIQNDSYLPSRLLSAEWEASYDSRSTRLG